MKLMFVSDIHRSLPATERVLGLLVRGDAQWLVIPGDVLNHSPRNTLPEDYTPAKVAERLNEVAYKVIAVHGNCDSGADQILLRFPTTAPWQQVLLEKQRLFLIYGHLFDPENLPALDQNDVLVYGHTCPPVTEQRGEIFHFNPGSVNIPKGGNPVSCGALDNDVLSVIALNDRNTITQVAANPQFTHNSKCVVRVSKKEGFLVTEQRRLTNIEWVDITNEENGIIA